MTIAASHEWHLLQQLLTVVVGRLDDHSKRMDLMSANTDALAAAVASLNDVVTNQVIPELNRLKSGASDPADAAAITSATDAVTSAVQTLQSAVAATQA